MRAQKGVPLTRRNFDPREYDHEEWADMCERFADPGGESALHPATRDNPRNLPCPSCGIANRLTARDVEAGYHCDRCSDQAERGGY